jgi:hypothetical protein
LISEQDLALLWGISIKTLKNKPFADLPEFTMLGRQRMFYVRSVEQYMRNHIQPRRRGR